MALVRKRPPSDRRVSASKSVKLEQDIKVPVDALLKQHVRLFDQWMLLGTIASGVI